jgi:hypothetical protein
LKAESVSRKSLVLAIGLALSAFSIGPVYSSQLPLVNVCDTPPALVNPENTFTPKTGVGMSNIKYYPASIKYNFNRDAVNTSNDGKIYIGSRM